MGTTFIRKNCSLRCNFFPLRPEPVFDKRHLLVHFAFWRYFKTTQRAFGAQNDVWKSKHKIMKNTELNDSRKIICLRKSEVSVERISVCNVTEN